jgi:hypothetical protein
MKLPTTTNQPNTKVPATIKQQEATKKLANSNQQQTRNTRKRQPTRHKP